MSGTLALFTFDGEQGAGLTDKLGGHTARIVGGDVTRIDGPPGCGGALRFGDTNYESYVEIPDSTNWQLTAGSVDFWFRPDRCGSSEDRGDGVLVRDAYDTAAGHLRLLWQADCRFELRLQTATDYFAGVTAAIPVGQWHHIGINFGGGADAELYLDGALAARLATTQGIDGSHNPWVLGADSSGSDTGKINKLRGFLRGAALGHLRISNVRRKFSD
jgi:hypothetical protein